MAAFAALGVNLSIILAGFIFAVGLWDIVIGVGGLVIGLLPASGDNGIKGLATIFKGLELMFLAPAVALTYASSLVFLKAKINRLKDILRKESGHGDVSINEENAHHQLDLHQVKVSITGLMIAVLLTDLIGHIIARLPFEPWALAASGTAITLCLLYYLVLTYKNDSH